MRSNVQMPNLNDMNDAAQIVVYPLEPALSADQASQLEKSIQKLFIQFEREEAAGPGLAQCCEDGHVLLVIYEESAQEGLSGCRKDKLAKLLLHFEEKHQVGIINAPPMLVKVAGTWQAHRRTKGLARPAIQRYHRGRNPIL